MSTTPIDLHWVQQPGSSVTRILRPHTFQDAARWLAAEPDLRPVAGGTDLLLELDRDRSAGTVGLIDLSAIGGWADIDDSNPAEFVLHAGVTHADVIAMPEAVMELLPLAQACLEIGSPQLRNRATIVGNLVTASPANDTISALLAMDASVSWIRYDDGDFVGGDISIEDFYTDFRRTALTPTAIVDSVTVPRLSSTQRGIWVKAGLRKAQAISVVHGGLVIDIAADQTITAARIALGSVGPTVALSHPAASTLVGATLDAATIDAASTAAADSVTPIDDGRATADYRRDSVKTVVSRALTTLAQGRERERWPARVPLISVQGRPRRATADESVSPRTSELGAGDEIEVQVNGSQVSGARAATGTLLDWLREQVGTGTKEGCAEGECGACTVQLDGAAVMSCLVPAVQADGAAVVTIEGLANSSEPNRMQQAFVDKFAVQCGYCIPGFVVAAQSLAQELGTAPTRDEVELALSGNLCRCTGYYNIIDAVTEAIAQEPA